MEKLKYSILVCAYGNYYQFSNFLRTAIGQSFTNYEIIVVDNASPDIGIYEACYKNSIHKVRYFNIMQEFKRTTNITQGINLAAANANGEYFVIVADSNVLLSFNLLSEIDKIIDPYSVVLSNGENCDVKISPDGQYQTEYQEKDPQQITHECIFLLNEMGWPCDPLRLKLIDGKHRWPSPHRNYDCYIVAMHRDQFKPYNEKSHRWGEYHQYFVADLANRLKVKTLQNCRIVHQYHRVWKEKQMEAT